MTDLQPWAAPTLEGLADLLAAADAETWDAPSLCEKWQVRHVVAHVTMPARLTPPQFGAEMAAAGGGFTRLSHTGAPRGAPPPPPPPPGPPRPPPPPPGPPPGGGAARGPPPPR